MTKVWLRSFFPGGLQMINISMSVLQHGDPGRGNRGENQSKNIEENTWFSYRGHPGLSENIGG